MTEIAQLAGQIARRGTRVVFGVPGSGASLSLADELERLGVSFVRTHFEGGAAIMAGTVGRLSGRAGIAITIKGPGLANLVPGLAVAWFESQPVVAICEAFPPDSAPSRAHKRMDHGMLAAAVAKGRRYLTATGPGFAELAAWAESERPGPVLLELAGTFREPSPAVPEAPDFRGDLQAVLALVERAKRPVVVAGALAARKGWMHALNALRIPVFSTAAAKGVVDESRPHAAGVYTGVGLELTPERAILPRADLVVGLGLRPDEMLAVGKPGAACANVDSLGTVAGGEDFEFDAICGVQGAEEVLAALGRHEWAIDEVRASVDRLQKHMLHAGRFLPVHAFVRIAERFGSDVRVVMDTGYFCTIGEHAWHAPSPDRCLLSGQGRYMGTCLPMAIGAAIADRSVPTVAVTGDGGIGTFIGEARIAVERRLPMLTVLMSDGAFASIRTRALKDELTQQPLTIAQPSWLRVMEGIGMPVWRADSADSLSAALGQWNGLNGPGYIEIVFDRDSYEQMVAGVR